MTAKMIWKFPLELKEWQALDMPIGSEVLTLQVQEGTPTLWVMVDPLMPKVKKHFHIVATGQAISEEQHGLYHGTWQSGPFVWHLFEVD